MAKHEKSLSAALGAGARGRREAAGLRQEDIARAARTIGLQWTQATVVAWETGRRELSAEELLLAPTFLQAAFGERVDLPDLLEDRTFFLHSRLVAGAADLRTMLRGEPLGIDVLPGITLRVGAGGNGAGEAERKAARRLGTSMEAIHEAAHRTWGRSLSAERDARVAERAPDGAQRRTIQALRGHVTRELLNELREQIERSD